MLYIVSTPIGNLKDITIRALETLKKVDLIVVENKKKSILLLKKFRIKSKITSLNNYNEEKKTNQIINKLKKKKEIALISDAGTPLINEPGYKLVYFCHKNKIKITPIPGPCAAIAALSVSGIPTNKFCFQGFIPKKKKDKQKIIKKLINQKKTTIFYESPKRIKKTLKEIVNILGPKRYITLAKEITKKWESIIKLKSLNLFDLIKNNKNYSKGEIVLIVSGCKKKNKKKISEEIIKTIKLLKKYIPFNKSIKIASKIYKIKKNFLYQYAIKTFLNKK